MAACLPQVAVRSPSKGKRARKHPALDGPPWDYFRGSVIGRQFTARLHVVDHLPYHRMIGHASRHLERMQSALESVEIVNRVIGQGGIGPRPFVADVEGQMQVRKLGEVAGA